MLKLTTRNGKFLSAVSPWRVRFIQTATIINPSQAPISIGQPLQSYTDYQMLSNMLKACKRSCNITTATAVHTNIIKCGLGTHTSLLSLVLSVYASSRNFDLARQMVCEISCSSIDLFSANLVIANFMKNGEIDLAKKVFHEMPVRDVVTWNSMIGGYVTNARFEEALSIFRKMLSVDIKPDAFTFSSISTACAKLGAPSHAKWIYGLVVERNIEVNHILCSALIDMFSKCGRVQTAKAIFQSFPHNDVSVWNAMINGLAINGLAIEAIEVFTQMQAGNFPPDSITFIGLLKACSHCGLVEQGHYFFDLMRNHYLIHPQLEHYGTMVDLYGRAGLLDEACAVIEGMQIEPDAVIWRAFLSACRIHKNSELGEATIAKFSNLQSGDYVLLSNIYSSVKNWDSAYSLRDVMKKKKIRKSIGKCWVELGGTIHQFMSGDRSHPETKVIYMALEALIQRTKMEGFIPTTELVVMDVSEEEKEENLNYHSEKIALAYAILKSSPGTEIHLSKNLRTCSDCHAWMKLVSKILNRVIIMRDRIRFHQFEGGNCTCRDYW